MVRSSSSAARASMPRLDAAAIHIISTFLATGANSACIALLAVRTLLPAFLESAKPNLSASSQFLPRTPRQPLARAFSARPAGRRA